MESSIPDDVSPEVASRWHQMFPVLTESEIARIGRFGTVRRYARGDRLFGAGEPGPGRLLVGDGGDAVPAVADVAGVAPSVGQSRGHRTVVERETSSGKPTDAKQAFANLFKK